MEGKEEGAKAPPGVEASVAATSELLSGSVGEDVGVKDSDLEITIPKCVNMKEMDGVVSLVHKLVPANPKWQLGSVL
jgi:hypothetical protein